MAGFVWVRQFRLDASSESLGSFRFVSLIWVRPGGRYVRSHSSGSSGYAEVVAEFVRMRLGGRCICTGSPGSYGCALMVSGFI